MKKNLARFLSDFFNPLVNAMAAFLSLIIADRNPAGASKATLCIVALFFCAALPLYALLTLKRAGRIGNVNIDDRRQRTVPFLLGAASYGVGFFVLRTFHAPLVVQGLMFAYAVNTLGTVVITKFWKISAHAMGVAGPLAALFVQFGAWTLPLFLLLPLVSWSRVFMKKHTVGQVVVGSIVGFVATWAQIHFLFR
jgi:membrane-associated phospholipid phosphatase